MSVTTEKIVIEQIDCYFGICYENIKFEEGTESEHEFVYPYQHNVRFEDTFDPANVDKVRRFLETKHSKTYSYRIDIAGGLDAWERRAHITITASFSNPTRFIYNSPKTSEEIETAAEVFMNTYELFVKSSKAEIVEIIRFLAKSKA